MTSVQHCTHFYREWGKRFRTLCQVSTPNEGCLLSPPIICSKSFLSRCISRVIRPWTRRRRYRQPRYRIISSRHERNVVFRLGSPRQPPETSASRNQVRSEPGAHSKHVKQAYIGYHTNELVAGWTGGQRKGGVRTGHERHEYGFSICLPLQISMQGSTRVSARYE